MKFRQMGKRILSLALSAVMLVSTGAMVQPASAAVAAFQPIQLEAAPTKIMDYFATQSPGGVVWTTNHDALTFLPAAAIGDVTCAVKATDGAVWVGTENGLMRMGFSEADARDMVQYFAGSRYLYGGDDKVTGLAADAEGGVWVRNAKGSVHIKMPVMTMEERTYFYEKMITDVNDRRGMVSTSNTFSYDPATGEYTQTAVHTSDNDGLWTAMYAMGEILRYQTLKKENASAAEIAAAKAAATRATKAVLLLDYVSGRGNGFPSRSYMLKSEALAQPDATGMQTQNGFWFEMKMLGETSYPDPIIDELKQVGTPIGIATVCITKDAMSKTGSRIFPNDTDYNGLGLSQSSIDTFNTVRAAGQKLGSDIKSTDGDQVFPLMVEGVNIGKKYAAPTSANPLQPNDSRIKFRLTAPVYEEIPTLFNDLFPDSAIKDGKIDMEQIVYKADTSSDEVDGHYALFITAYRYLCDEPGDSELKNIIAETTMRMTDLILEDDRYYIVDATGKSTQWSRWLARYFNDSLDVMQSQALWLTDNIGVDENSDDMLSYGYEDGPLNALEVMSALKIAAYIADGEGETAKAATYHMAYDQCFESPYSGGGVPNNPSSYVNGKGYMDMALEYVERRIVRQATDAYNANDNEPVRAYVERESDFDNRIFNNALHADWTQYVNYSDEELGWFPIYTLITLEQDSGRLAKIVAAYDQWYDGQEEREENPFYTFVYQMAHPEKTDVDLQSAVRYLYRSPLVRNSSFYVRGGRQDVFYIEAGNRDKRAQTNYALTLDERAIEKNNSSPFTAWTGLGQGSGTPYLSASMGDATVFTLPYWLGRYYGIITEAEGSYYTRKTPDVTIIDESGSVSVTVLEGETPLERMIVDFYEDGAYIGRARTDASGVATLAHAATGTLTATVGERLIGKIMYNHTEARPPHPTAIRLSIPENMEMVTGEHHSIDFVILPDSNPYRGITWLSSDEAIATVDLNGRVTAVGPGSVTITAKAKADPSVTGSGVVTVVNSASELSEVTAKAVVKNYEGTAASEVQNLQKYVDRYTKEGALAAESVPAAVKAALNDASVGSLASITAGTATWSVESYGIRRADTSPVHARDAEQLFMGSRYLPSGAIIHIEADGAEGLWVASSAAVTHIRMEEVSYTDKAAEMSAATQEHVARRGMVSRAQLNGTTWAPPKDDDNDGLWTGMYGVGELMRYSVLREDPSATPQDVAAARDSALNSIKAVLLLSNITCRTGEVEAYIRPLQNDSNQYNYTKKQADNLMANSGLALLKGKDFSVNNPQSGPVGAIARDGSDNLLAPFFPGDWALVTKDSKKADFATRTRTLEGMIARTYVLDGEFPGMNYNDGYYWNIQGNTATCESTASNKVRWESLSGTTVDASGEIPAAVTDLLDGASKDNVIYKTDTSTDEVIGHLFIYKVAYDILDDNDTEEAAVKELLVDTVRRIARHLADNGYSFRDSTGQATTWGKTERDYFNNSYAWEDCALNSLVNLCVFKLAGYVTGEARWENEYRMLALGEPYRYADLAGEYWDRWAHLAIVDGGLSENASQAEINTWIQQKLNYSDEEMAMLAYYILFQMEDDSALIGKYQDGIDSWWNSIQYSENPLWYYIYQLAYPAETQTDIYGNALVDTAAWALSRHPIDTICWGAHNDNRPDVVRDGKLSRDKTTGEIRVVPQDERALHRFNGPTYELNYDLSIQMEPSTTYTLPYWMGRYHHMITPAAP